MKRSLFVLFVVIAAIGAAPLNVRYSLEKALVNEREAVARYEACAQKAVEEGYLGAASLFRAAARAERVHATRFEQAMTARGMTIPEAAAYTPSIGNTADNLRQSISLENAERDGLYRQAIDAASSARDQSLVTMFDQTRDTEVEHANLMSAALRDLDNFKAARTFHVCDDCGYTTDVELPLCALCRTRGHTHTVE
jgi:rubrerythrin